MKLNLWLSALVLVVVLSASAPGRAQEGGKPLATAEHESGLIVEVLEVRPDNNEMLTIRWQYRNPTNKTIELIAATPRFRGTNPPPNRAEGFYRAVYYVEGKLETAAAFKHGIVTEKGKNNLYAKDLGKNAVRVGPNQKFEVWAKFSLPRERSEQAICLHLQGTPLIENVPIQEAGRRKGSE
jgi:hypothetical protein